MKFVTFQPLIAYKKLKNNKSYKSNPIDETSYDKIYAIKLDEQTRRRLYCIAPSMPQVCIIFDTERYEEIDSINHCNEILAKYKNIRIENINSKYKEYIIDKIYPNEVIEMSIISVSENVDIVQDSYINAEIDTINKLSIHEWISFPEAIKVNKEFSQNIAINYVKLVQDCMMPWISGTILTEEKMDKLYDMVDKYFIKQ